MPVVIRNATIATANARKEIFLNTSVVIDNNRITALLPSGSGISDHDTEIIDAAGFVLIPGFIQTHIHLCQTLFRGLADDLELLDWLRLRIFPLELAHNEHSMYASALIGIAELIRSGTTTILDMGSVNHEEEIIRSIGETGLRAFVGKAMMDVNEIFPRLKESTEQSLKSTLKLAEQWHNSYDGRIHYAVAPRFVLSCTDRLMREAFEMTSSFPGMLFHTHASENLHEVESIRARCKMDNVEFLNHLGVLSERSCLAHCIHLNNNEYSILKSTKARVVHCPSSNLKLGSGIANIPKLLGMDITVSLGADGAPCNNNLNMFREMRLASLIQKPFHGPTAMPAETIFRLATIEGAKALGVDKEIGSIEPGKKADLVLLNLKDLHNPVNSNESLYSSIVYSAGQENVDSVMIDGKWVFRKREFQNLDDEQIVASAKKELINLTKRL